MILGSFSLSQMKASTKDHQQLGIPRNHTEIIKAKVCKCLCVFVTPLRQTNFTEILEWRENISWINYIGYYLPQKNLWFPWYFYYHRLSMVSLYSYRKIASTTSLKVGRHKGWSREWEEERQICVSFGQKLFIYIF